MVLAPSRMTAPLPSRISSLMFAFESGFCLK